MTKKKPELKLKIAFDVNGTLSQEPVRVLFLAIDRSRYEVIVWSTMGADYARDFCEAHELSADTYARKNAETVDLAIDDSPTSVKTAKSVIALADWW